MHRVALLQVSREIRLPRYCSLGFLVSWNVEDYVSGVISCQFGLVCAEAVGSQSGF